MDSNPIYKFMKDNGLTQKDEATFVSEYSNPQKSAELHKFMTDNSLTTKGADDFYNEYFNPSKKKGGTTKDSEQRGEPSAPSFGQKITEKIVNSASQTQVPLKTGLQQEKEKQAAEMKAKVPTSKYFEVDVEEKQDANQAPKFADPIVVAKNSQKSKAIFNSVIGDKDIYKMPTRGESQQYASEITDGYLDYLELAHSNKSETYKEKYKSLKAKPKADRSEQDEEFLRQVEAEAVGAFYDAKEWELGQVSSEIDNLQKTAVTDEQKATLNNLYGQYEKKRDSLLGTSSVYAQNKLQYGKIAGKEMLDEEAKLRRFEALQAGDGKTIEFFKGIGGAVANGVLSVAQVPKVFGDLIGDTDYDWSDQMYDMVSGQKSDLDREFGAPLPKGKSMSDLPLAARLAVVGGNAIGSAGLFAAGGGLIGATSNLGKAAATFGTAFLTSESGYYQEALDAGMSPQDAALAGTYLAAQTALIESIIPDVKYFEPSAFRKSIIQGVASGIGKGLSVKEAAKLGLKNAIKAAPESALAYGKTGIKEAGEELLGQVGEDVGKEALNVAGQRQYFNDTFNPENYTDAILGGFIAGGGMSVFSRPTPKSPIQEETMREIVERRPQETQKGTASDKINKEDLSALDDVTEIYNAMNSHSGWNVMSREEQNHALALAQQVQVMKKEQERMKELRIPDERKDAEIKKLEDEVNQMFSVQMDQDKQKAKNAKLKAIEDEFNKSMEGEEFPVQEDERDQEIVELQKQREERGVSELDTFLGDMKPMVPFAVERTEQELPVAQSVKQAASNYLYKKYKELTDMKSDPNRMMTRQQIANVQKQLEQDIRTLEGTTQAKTETNDQENIQGVPGEVGVGQEPVTIQPIEGTSTETTEAGGVLQAPEEEVTPTTEATPEEVKPTPRKINVLGEEVNMYNDYIPSKAEDVEPGAMYTFNADSKNGIPSLLHGIAYANKIEVNGVKTENWHASISGDELLKLYPKETKAATPQVSASKEVTPTTEAAPETAPTPKPTKPTFKQRVSKIFDPEGAKAAEDLARFHQESGIDIEIIDDVEAQRLGQERNMEGNLEGLFIADKDSGKIYLNRDALKRVGKTLAYHEGIHPVINIIRNTNPELYKKIVDGIKAEAKRNPAIARAIRQVESVKEYQKRGPETIEDEIVVEVLARIAAGDIDINKIDKTLKDNLIQFWNWIAKKLKLGTINANPNSQEMRDFAKKLSTALTQGGKLSDVVGAENVKAFAPPPSLEIKEKENISNYEENIPIPGVIRAGQASVEIDRSTNTPIDVYQEKGVKKLPVKTLKQIYDKFNKKVVVINSDPTRVGWLTLPSGKRIFMYGGPGYLSVLDNTKGDVGFATTQESKVKSWKKYVDELFGKKPGVTLIATQAPTAILSNSYALRYVLDAISQLPKSVLESETFKNEFFGNDIALLKDAFGDKKYNEFINKYKNADLSNPKIIDNMISEMSYTIGDDNAPASFKARGAFVANLLGGLGEKSKSQKIEGDKGYYSKKPQKYIASELMNRLGINAEKVIRDIGEPGLVDLYMNEGKWGFAVSGFETDPNMDISSIQNLGVTHPLFNAKFPGKNAFLLDGAYEIDAMFKPIEMTGPKGEPYTKRASLMLAGSMYVKGGAKQGGQTFKYQLTTPSGIGVLPVPTPERITKASENLQAKFRRDGIPLSKQEAIEIVEELASWKDWYEGIAQMVQDNFGEYAADYMMFMFGSAVAADSAGTIGTALNNLERLYAQEEIKGLPIMKRNIYEILSGLPVSSDKISNFIAAGLGDKNAIPVDMHVWSFINSLPETKGPTKKDFDKAKEFVRAVADGLGWDPREVQAAMWAANMLRLGQRPDTYEEYIQKKIDAGLQEQIQGWRDKGYKPVFAVRQAGEKIETVFLQEEKKAEFAPKLEEVKRAISPKGQASVSIDRSKEGDLQPLPEGINIVNGWYSPIEKKLRETKADKQSAQKWLTSGIIGKGDEAIYTGVKGWLESKKPTDQVSKQEILDWMDNNRVEIQEISKSNEPKMSNAEARNVFENQGYDVVTDRNGDTYVEKDEELYDYNDMSPVEQDAFDVLTRGNLDTGRQMQTKYQTYQLEGEKKNYKELLVTLPTERQKATVVEIDGKWRIKHTDGSLSFAKYTSKEFAEKDLKEYIENEQTSERTDATTFRSSHFDEPNILVHLRMNTRTDVDGNKVLFLEELQSDWGQKGKREGFVGNVKELPSNYKIKKIPTYGSILGDYRFEVIDNQGGLRASGNTEAEAKENALQWLNKKGTPSAPFVTDTNAWTKLGLKMALREAVKQGADKVAWTTGEQQNERYDLSKQVDSINYLKNADGTYQVYAKKNGDIIFKEKALEENKLEGAFGKDVAERIINDKGTSEEGLATKVLSGSDLSVGGKGMKGFYDNIVPNVATALVKELTGEPGTIGTTVLGEKTQLTKDAVIEENRNGLFNIYDREKSPIPIFKNIETREQAENILSNPIKNASTQQSIEITPKLKASVNRGVAQFSANIPRTSSEIRQSMEDSGDAVEQAIASGTDPQTAVDNLIGNQDWYKELTPNQKQQFDEILQDEFGVTPKTSTKKPTGVKSAISNIVDNYYKIKDGTRAEKTAARDAINQILDSDPKLKYIYNNIRDINKQLQAAGVITEKTDGCP